MVDSSKLTYEEVKKFFKAVFDENRKDSKRTSKLKKEVSKLTDQDVLQKEELEQLRKELVTIKGEQELLRRRVLQSKRSLISKSLSSIKKLLSIFYQFKFLITIRREIGDESSFVSSKFSSK